MIFSKKTLQGAESSGKYFRQISKKQKKTDAKTVPALVSTTAHQPKDPGYSQCEYLPDRPQNLTAAIPKTAQSQTTDLPNGCVLAAEVVKIHNTTPNPAPSGQPTKNDEHFVKDSCEQPPQKTGRPGFFVNQSGHNAGHRNLSTLRGEGL